MEPVYFSSGAEFGRWLEKNHASAAEIEIGFFNKASGQQGISYAEALDEALCFGWIDGIIHKIDAKRHTRRFTPRRPNSNWSLVNVRHFARLQKLGRIRPAGAAAFGRRSLERTGIYSFEKRPSKFPAELARKFRADAQAWSHWSKQPPGYQRVAIWWVISAKQESTRERRLTKLISLAARGKRLS